MPETNYYLPNVEVDLQWVHGMPFGAKKFFVDDGRDIDLGALLKFWENHRDRGHKWWKPLPSWSLAQEYVWRGDLRSGRNLLLNGAFVQYAYCKTDSINSAVRAISEQIQLTGLQHPSLVAESRMDVIYQMTLENNNNFASLIEPNSMELARGPMMNYLRDVCTNETAGLYIKSERNNYVNWVSDGWEAESKRKGKHCKGGAAIDDDDDDIHITFLDDDNREVKKMKIGRSQKLKLLFNGYAEEVGVSLRSLRFSYEGKALFLSSAGSMTPADMDMNDLSFITVTDTTKASDGEESTMSASFSTFNINDSSSHKKGKGKSKKGKSKKNKTPK